MGSLLSYSGISAKIRAMQSRLIRKEQLEEILQLESVPQVAAYLKRTPGYAKRWEHLNENSLHRGQIEKLLKQSMFDDFTKLWLFADKEQRVFLSLYAKNYEIRVLKELMTNIFDRRSTETFDISFYEDFFRRHSRVDLPRLAACGTMEEFAEALKGTEYYMPLMAVQGIDPLIFDDGMALDLYYFSRVWSLRKKLFTGRDLEELTRTFGEKIDMLNLQFIRRSRRYYDMDPAAVYAVLIPVSYRLSRADIQKLVELPQAESEAYFQKTYYGRKYQKLSPLSLEEFYNVTLRNLLEKEARENPHSVAVLYRYLYSKEHEVYRLTLAVESVRYGADPRETMKYIENS